VADITRHEQPYLVTGERIYHSRFGYGVVEQTSDFNVEISFDNLPRGKAAQTVDQIGTTRVWIRVAPAFPDVCEDMLINVERGVCAYCGSEMGRVAS
jgi:hypothetical protein